MGEPAAPLHLLILHDTQNEAEPLVNLFRNAGMATRSHFIASEDELISELGSQTWDLLLAKLTTDTVNVSSCLQRLKAAGTDVPVIVLLDDFDPQQVQKALALGAKDAVIESEPDLVRHSALREVTALKHRRQLRQAQRHLKDSEKRVQLLLESSKDAIAYVHDGMHIYANNSYMELFGYEDPDDLLCLPIIDLVDSDKKSELKACLKSYSDGSSADMSCKVETADGAKVQVQMDFSGATYDGEACTQIVIRADTGNNQELEAKIQEISQTDMATGLFNRRHFQEQLDLAYKKAMEAKQSSTVMYVRIQAFDELRVTYGIAGGEVVQRELAELLKQSEKDGVMAKVADDVFAILVPSSEWQEVQERGLALVEKTKDLLVELEGKTIRLNINVGLALLDDKCSDANEAMGHAHQAAERAGKSEQKVQFFDKSDLRNISDDNLVGRINLALENNAFNLMFQPIISLRGDSQEHYEAFVRMKDSQGQDVAPKDFIAAAQAANLSGKIDRWVVAKTVAELAEQRKKGSNTQVVINLTPSSISDPAFLPWVNSQLKNHKLRGDCLVFQIREKDAQAYLKAAKAFSKGLSVLKCKLSISQFGRSEQDFDLNRHLDIEYIKVHGSFVEAVEEEGGAERLEALVSQIHELDVLSVAPQVDNASIMSILWQAGVNYIQGQLLQEPTEEMDYDFSEDSEEAV